MPINQIQIPTRQKEDSALDKIAQGLNIINSTLGIALSVPKFMQERKVAESEIGLKEAQAKKASRIDPLEAAETAEKQRRLAAPQGDMIQKFSQNFPNQPPPATVGGMEDIYKAQAGAITVTPFEREKYGFEKQKYEQDQKDKAVKLEQERNSRFIKELGGWAPTVQDAKEIKEAIIANKQATTQLDKVINLRKNLGATVLDREAVAAAKQAAADVKLQIKTMAQLGVLSKTDFEFLDQLMPNNPLAYTGAMVMGQDPIMTQLQNLRQSIDERFKTQVQARGINREFTPANEVRSPTAKEADDF